VTSDANLNKLFADCTGNNAGQCFDNNNPFFLSLGTNGRRCVTCHVPSSGMAITPVQIQAIGAATGFGITPDSLGLSALFRPIDAANNPNDPNAVSTDPALRQKAYSLILAKGLIDISPRLLPSMPFSTNPQFTITSIVNDPYGFVSLGANDQPFPYYQHVQYFRRPVPLLAERAIVTIMWDGRESPSQVGCTANGVPLNPVLPPCTVGSETLDQDFFNQASHATTGHAQASQPLTPAQEKEILDFQKQLAVAQSFDNQAGDLTANSARGGPNALLSFPSYIGINDNFGNCGPMQGADPLCRVLGAPLGIGQRDVPFNLNVFTIYNSYSLTPANAQQSSIARGQAAFNGSCTTNSLGQPVNCVIPIAGVNGINDQAAFCKLIGQPAPCGTINGNCTTCHDSPNFGNHSVARQLNIGLMNDPEFMTSDQIIYQVSCNAVGAAAHACDVPPLTPSIIGGPPGDCTGQLITNHCHSTETTDLMKGFISGLISEVGMGKGAMLRALVSRTGLFHDAFAQVANNPSDARGALLVAIQFYEDRFDFVFDPGVVLPRLQGCGNVAPPQNAATCPVPSPASPTELDLVNFLSVL
jgi:hypothetical protein